MVLSNGDLSIVNSALQVSIPPDNCRFTELALPFLCMIVLTTKCLSINVLLLDDMGVRRSKKTWFNFSFLTVNCSKNLKN
jgi:hypothetical protein